MKLTQELIEYDITTVAIEEMKQKYSGLKITDAKSDKAVRAARTLMVSKRTAVEKRRIELNESANDWRKKVNAKAKEITALLLPIEEPLQAECKRVDDEIKARREAKEAKERERIEGIQEKIKSINKLGLTTLFGDEPSSTIAESLTLAKGIAIAETEYMEFTNQALQAQKELIATLEKALADRLQFEKEVADQKAEAERLEAQRKEQAEAQAKIDEENRKIEEAKAKIEAEKQAEIARKEKEALIKATQEETKRMIEQAKDKMEKERLEREEAEKKEKVRQEELKPDKDKLIKFAQGLIDIEAPHLKSGKAITIAIEAQAQLSDLSVNIKEQANKL